MKKDISIYVHIPFCNSRCNYCAFVSKVGTDEEKQTYIKDLISEIKMRAKEYNEYFSVRSIFIGGGTPSCLNNYEIRDVLSCLYKSFSVRNNAEITIEVNPNSLTKTKIREYILSGVNRFSIGLQSGNNKLLKQMGRTHTLSDFDNAISNLREQGISNINADIIIGYPNQTLKDVEESVKHLLELKLPHVSCYMLQVEEKTKLKALVDNGSLYITPEEKIITMYNSVVKMLKANGYNRYELSNFSKPGFESYHNKVYWQGLDYLGFGVSAHSLISNVRFCNTQSILEYNRCINQIKKPPVESAKQLTVEEQKEEMIMLSLRTTEGLNTELYNMRFNENFIAKRKDKIANLIKNGYIVLSADKVLKPTDKGYLVLNRIIYELV